MIPRHKPVVIKPNLINDSPPPVTTPVACCEALVTYLQSVSDTEIVVAEGCGEPGLETEEVFQRLGYTDMARRLGVRLVDLNTAELVCMRDKKRPVFSEMHLPGIVLDCFLISVPVLKAHSLSQITGGLKNMIGIAPPAYYQGRGGSWKKAAFHAQLHQAILDLNAYRAPDCTLMDASVGLADYHLGGPRCDPEVGKLVAGYDVWEVDRKGAELLGLDWTQIHHLV